MFLQTEIEYVFAPILRRSVFYICYIILTLCLNNFYVLFLFHIYPSYLFGKLKRVGLIVIYTFKCTKKFGKQ